MFALGRVAEMAGPGSSDVGSARAVAGRQVEDLDQGRIFVHSVVEMPGLTAVSVRGASQCRIHRARRSPSMMWSATHHTNGRSSWARAWSAVRSTTANIAEPGRYALGLGRTCGTAEPAGQFGGTTSMTTLPIFRPVSTYR